MPFDDTYVLTGVFKEGLNKVNLGTDWSQGANVTVYTANPEGGLASPKDGTEANPVTTARPTFKVSRTSAVTGGVTGDGATELAAVYGSSYGISTSKVQEIGVLGTAKNKGTAGEPDAAGVYGVGRILAGGKGRAFGGFFLGRRDGAEQRATGAEIAVENASGEADVYDITNGAETTKGLWIHGGTAKSAVGVQIGTINGAITGGFDVGIGINQESVAAASFQDNSKSAKSIEVKGEHGTAAIETANAAGPTILNNNFLQFAERATPAAAPADGARLYIKDNGSGKTQLAVIFNTGTEIILATQA